ncbi:MAG TPA: FecR domain-containing protein [Chitinophaga sp.]|uniref:FecR family protein n=1 Tax=Chitinophaga sp. TaxID=1869181 RepID=UPI002F92AE01
MERQRLFYLLSTHAAGRLTEEEWQELAAYAMDPVMSGEFQQQLVTLMEQAPAEPVVAGEEWQSLLKAVMDTDKAREEDPVPLRRVPSFFRRWSWAAVLIPVLAIGIYFLAPGRKDRVQPPMQAKAADIAPGRNGAVLTLANGTQVVLDSLGNGVIATQKGAKVLLKAGQLSYAPVQGEGVDFNSITTPKGRQFKLVLPDGTGVWLNAASSLRYPVSFTGKTRQVEVTGEAYFEVAENANMPFHVKVNGNTNIEVLGTHFNVNAYENEQHISTTLVAGRIKVSAGTAAASVILEPGQQAQTGRSAADLKVVSNADIEKTTAWKNGLFNFNGATLHEVMRQLERWYDIEVVYEKGAPDITFWGKMTKDISLNGLLIGLEKSDVHLRLEGRKLIVLP